MLDKLPIHQPRSFLMLYPDTNGGLFCYNSLSKRPRAVLMKKMLQNLSQFQPTDWLCVKYLGLLSQ